MSRMTEHIDRVVGGRYRSLAPIGRGASAQVFVADDVRLRRQVAEKVLHAGLAEDQAFLRRFRIEAQAAAALARGTGMTRCRPSRTAIRRCSSGGRVTTIPMRPVPTTRSTAKRSTG